MSYFNLPRLHFAGTFQAAPSTVNNDPLHFDNANFVLPDYWERQTSTALNGWWNPKGDAAWRLIGCKVTGAWIGYDQDAAADDPIGACSIADAGGLPAKIVDLDTEQQLTSEVWGLRVRIQRSDGTNLLQARYEPAAFMDIWDRAQGGGGGDVDAAATFQSVLTDLQWGDVSGSKFLTLLKQAASEGLLSIKFNVDGYNMSFGSPDFTKGRIVGTIGPASSSEPKHFVLGRQFRASGVSGVAGANFFRPTNKVNFCAAIVDQQAGKIILDLGNSLPTPTPGGAMSNIGTLALGYIGFDSNGNPQVQQIDTVNYTTSNWYAKTAGVVALPTARKLTSDELTAIAQTPLVLTLAPSGSNPQIAIAESPNGTYVRADRFVYRVGPGDEAKVRLFATQWGARYGGARIVNVFDPSQLQTQAGSPLGTAPAIGAPLSAVDFPARVIADQNGVAELPIRISDPGTPRSFIDGQVYGVRPMLEQDLDFGSNYIFNQWDFISLLVFSGFQEENPPTWYGSMEPIFRQYHNLYPVMQPIVDMSSYDSICDNVSILEKVFGLPLDDPDSMPVTRDLSAAKRGAILRWLQSPGADGKPLKGVQKPAAPLVAATAVPASLQRKPEEIQGGGKAAAASRRLMVRRRALTA